MAIVVTDDGSTDESAEWIHANHPDVHVLAGSGTLWWSGGMNQGARYGLQVLNADYILCWNNDILCDSNYFSNLSRLLYSEPRPTLLGSKIYLLDPPNVVWAMGCSYDPRTGRHVLIGSWHVDCDALSVPIQADWTPGMGTVLSRDVFQRIGFWDAAAFPQYHGDSDFCLQAKHAGFRLIIEPELRVWNDKSSSGIRHGEHLLPFLRSFVRLNSNYHFRTQWRFCRRHGSSWRAYRHLVFFYLGYIAGFLKWSVLKLIGIKRRRPPVRKELCA